jgi:multisubunit Na+/H+ antiporter MnhC subunit
MSTSSPTTLANPEQWMSMIMIGFALIGIVLSFYVMSYYHRGKAHIQNRQRIAREIIAERDQIIHCLQNKTLTEGDAIRCEQRITKVLKRLDQLNAPESTLSETFTSHLSNSFVQPIQEHEGIGFIEREVTSTTNGRLLSLMFTKLIFKIEMLLNTAGGMVFGFWANCIISTSCSPEMGNQYATLTAILIVLGVFISIFVTMVEQFFNTKLGATGVNAESVIPTTEEEKKAAIQEQQQQNVLIGGGGGRGV